MIAMFLSMLLTVMMVVGSGFAGGDAFGPSSRLSSEEKGKIRGALAGLYLTVNGMEGYLKELPGRYWDDQRNVEAAYRSNHARMTEIQIKALEMVVNEMRILEKTAPENPLVRKSSLRMGLIMAMKEFE
jgi:hypothetical protein